MIDTAAQFSKGEVMPLQDRLDTQEDGLMPSLIKHAGELGLCGIDTSDQYGGLGLSKNLAIRMLEFLSLNASFSVTIGVTSGISQCGVGLFGNDEQRSRFLPPLAAGQQIGAYCLSEPNSGTDALSMSTRADEDGDHFRLTGTKMWISNAKWASQFLVMAKIGGEKITAFVVERDTPGVTIEREEHKVGLKGSSTARVTLDNARVPAANLVYEPGRGHIVAFNALNIGRLKLAAMSIGPARTAMYEASGYAQDRKQFGQPIGRFGLIEQKFAEMAARFFAAESMIYRAGADMDLAFDQAHASETDGIKANMRGAETMAIECSMSKVFATEAEAFIVDECFQTYGGYGFTEEFPLARIYRDCRVSRIYEGTNEINRFFIADRLKRQVEKVGQPTGDEGFIHGLFLKALAQFTKMDNAHQSVYGAVADLAILHYAEQSCRLRLPRNPALYTALYQLYCNWANTAATRAYQIVCPESVAVPSPQAVDLSAVAAAVYSARGPLSTA